MKTTHLEDGLDSEDFRRPESLKRLTSDDFCKAKYSQNDQRCYTARLIDIFLKAEEPYVEAYIEFRLASMDYLYKNHGDDHCSDAKSRSKAFNSVAEGLGYKLT